MSGIGEFRRIFGPARIMNGGRDIHQIWTAFPIFGDILGTLAGLTDWQREFAPFQSGLWDLRLCGNYP